MNKRLIVVVLFALYMQPVAAADSVMDLSFSTSPLEQFYAELDSPLRCLECALSYWECICVLSQSSQSSLYRPAVSNKSSFCDTDTSAHTDLSGVFEYVNELSQPLIVDTVQSINANATSVHSDTVGFHIDDTYVPGFRPSALSSTPCTRRHAPRKNGFACTVQGCNKAFDRNCELNRHVKTHLGRNERPHKCTDCGEGFLYPKDLIRHQRKHVRQASAKVTHYCLVEGCPNLEGFSRRDNLLRHHRRQHAGVASPSA